MPGLQFSIWASGSLKLRSPLPKGCITYSHTAQHCSHPGKALSLTTTKPFLCFFSATSPASNTLPAETLLTDGWHNILLTGIHWLHNVTINLKYQRLDNTYFYFALVKLTSNHYVTHNLLQKVNVLAPLSIQKRTALQLAIHWQLNFCFLSGKGKSCGTQSLLSYCHQEKRLETTRFTS